MDLVFHGGNCCGIKTIKGFSHPASLEGARVIKGHGTMPRNDACGSTVSSDLSAFNEAAPKETQVERLDRLITYCKQSRKKGLIEIVLASLSMYVRKSDGAQWDYGMSESDMLITSQYRVWKPIIEERGFKEVAAGMNSNSGNTCHVFYLDYTPA